MWCKPVQMEAYKQKYTKTHQKITRVVDGDGLFVMDLFSRREVEVRLLGIDAPEPKKCKKLLQDERESHLPGQLLMELGQLAKRHLATIALVDITVTLIMEKQESVDVYGRTLAYVLLPDGSSLNERMILDGYAKPYDKYYCECLPRFQQLHTEAKTNKRGLYGVVGRF